MGLQVFADLHWECVWPRPAPCDAASVAVALRPNARLRLQPLMETGPPCATQWWKLVDKLLNHQMEPHLADVMRPLVPKAVARPFLVQLLHGFSLCMESCCLASIDGLPGAIQLQHLSLKDLIRFARGVDQLLVRHV